MRNVLLVICLIVLSTPAWSADPASPKVSKSEKTWLQNNADQPYIALVNEYATTINADWSYEETYHARIKVQKEEAKELGQWPVYYNSNRDELSDIQAYVETPDGRKFPAIDITDAAVYPDFPMYADMKMKIVTLPEVNVGSVIDVTVRSKTKSKEIPGEFWGEILYPAIPTMHAIHMFIFPEGRKIHFRGYKTENNPIVDTRKGQQKYTFTFNETEPLPEDETLMPPLQDVLGGLYISSMEDWSTVAEWYRNLVNKNSTDTPEITAKALELTKDKTTDKDKTRAILEYIQDNFRYVPMNFGDNTIEPHKTSEVFTNKYGDSKDLTLLTRHLLKSAGVESKVCFFSGEFAGNPQNGLPNPSVFASVILQVDLDGKTYFIDPILKGFDFGFYPSSYDNALVMIIDKKGYQFDRIPAAPEDVHALISKADITIQDNGAAEFKVHVKLPMEASQSFKSSWTTSSKEEKDKFFNNLEQNFAKGGKMMDRKVLGVEDRYGIVEFDLRYQSPTAYPLVNEMMLIKEEDQSDIPEFVAENRKYPIFVGSNALIKNFNTYHLPVGFKITAMPSNYSLSSDLMDVSVNYLQKDDAVTIDSTYHTKRALLPPEKYKSVRDFRSELFKKLDQYIILKKASAISAEAKDWVKGQ